MDCRLNQRMTSLERGEGQKFLHFRKLHIQPFVRAKFQANRNTFDFDDFLQTPLEDLGPKAHKTHTLEK